MKANALEYTVRGKKLFSDLSFNTVETPLVVIHGPNGAGKSTLLKVLLGIKKVDKGEVVANESVGYVPDSTESFFIGMSPQVLFRFLSKQLQLEESLFSQRLDALKALFGFNDKLLNTKIQNLSLGEKKKTMLIAAFLGDPQVYVMDEPFSGLDNKTLDQLLVFIEKELNVGKAFVVATHDHEAILSGMAKSVRVLRLGETD